jgi:hypothetical protein
VSFASWAVPAIGGDPLTGFLRSVGAYDWFDADQGSQLTLSSGAVQTWTGAKGAAPTQGTAASRPTYAAGSHSWANFDGTDDCLIATSGLPSVPTTGIFEMVAVVRQDVAGADGTIRAVAGFGDTSLNSWYIRRASSGGVNRAQFVVGDGASAQTLTQTSVDLSGAHVVSAWYTGVLNIEVDGSSQASGSFPSVTVGTVRLKLAGSPATSTNNSLPWSGGLNFVAVMPVLTTAQRLQLRTLLTPRTL